MDRLKIKTAFNLTIAELNKFANIEIFKYNYDSFSKKQQIEIDKAIFNKSVSELDKVIKEGSKVCKSIIEKYTQLFSEKSFLWEVLMHKSENNKFHTESKIFSVISDSQDNSYHKLIEYCKIKNIEIKATQALINYISI